MAAERWARARKLERWPVIDVGPYDDGAPGSVAVMNEMPEVMGRGEDDDEAEVDLADAFAWITWH